MNDSQCPFCNAPVGKPHGYGCTGNNGNSYTAVVQGVYSDSKNRNSFAEGLEFQDFVVDELAQKCGFIIQQYASKYYQIKRGESVQRCEIKLDNLCTSTKRLSIEVAEKTYAAQQDFLPSGIFSPTKPLFYVHGNRKCFWLFATKDLITYSQRPTTTHKAELTVKAFYMPMTDADEIAIICIKNGY